MTREEAVQIQIDECLDNFNAEECATVCEFLWQRGHHCWPDDWHDSEGTFFPSALRKYARSLLKEVSSEDGREQTWGSGAYFLATKEERRSCEPSAGLPYLALDIWFWVSDRSFHDGTSYDAES